MPISSPPFRRPRIGAHIPISYFPYELAAKYGWPTGITGPTLPIGIVSLGGGYNPSDIATAFAGYQQAAPKVTDVSILGAVNRPGDPADAENLLDIQVSGGIFAHCTGRAADIRFYSAPNTDAGFKSALARAISDKCGAIGISWGSAEKNWGATPMGQFDLTASQATQPIFVASGDNGSSDGLPGANADFPGSSPHVVCCGGTTKTQNTEVVWNGGQGEGTGGGISAFFQQPTWQLGTPHTGGYRSVPDMAANADPQTGWRIVEGGSWTLIGGTSAVAPAYAGLFAAINSARVGASLLMLTSVDLLKLAYATPASFTDIVQGDNGQWRAGVGVDFCTGLGVLTKCAVFLPQAGPPPPTIPQPPHGFEIHRPAHEGDKLGLNW